MGPKYSRVGHHAHPGSIEVTPMMIIVSFSIELSITNKFSKFIKYDNFFYTVNCVTIFFYLIKNNIIKII